MRNAGYIILISAALHVAGVAMAGFSGESLSLLIPVAIYLLLFAGLARGMMGVAWIALIAMLGGAAGAIVELYSVSVLPEWALWGILGADLVAAVLLFGAIWRGQHQTS